MDARVQALWRTARKDVALPEDLAIGLMAFPGELSAANSLGDSVEPGCDAWEKLGNNYFFTPELQEQAIREQGIHQVLVHAELPDVVLLALMRHELEHVRQHVQSLWITRTSTSLNRAFERCLEPLPGAFRGLYPHLPCEQDASAAATRLAKEQFSADAVARAAAGHTTLLGTERPSGPYESLPQRLIALAALHPDLFDAAVRELFLPAVEQEQRPAQVMASGLLGDEDGPRLYAACLVDPEISRVRDRLVHAVPAAWAQSMDAGQAAWATVADDLAQVQRRGAALARDPGAQDGLLASVAREGSSPRENLRSHPTRCDARAPKDN
jgi:hypothetical protein